MDAVTISIVVVMGCIGYILGFWAGVNWEKEKIQLEILELTSSIKYDENKEKE